MLCNSRAYVLVQSHDRFAGEIAVRIEQRKRAFLRCECGRGEISFALYRAEPALGRRDGGRRAITQPAEDQRIGEAGDPEADATLLARLLLLLGEREQRDVDDIVHHADAFGYQPAQPIEVEPRVRGEWLPDEAREVDRAQQACAIGRQGLLAARV